MQSNLNPRKRKVDDVCNGEQGFSIVEVIVAMVIFLIITGAIYGALQAALRSRSVVNQQVPLTKSVRLGLNLVGRDTYNAGFGYPLSTAVVVPNTSISTLLGIPNDTDPLVDRVPPIIAGNNITLNTYNLTPGVRTDQVTFLFKDSTFNLVPLAQPLDRRFSAPLNIPAALTVGGIDEIAPLTGTNAACAVNEIYLISGGNGSTLGVSTALSGGDKVHFANLDVLGFNQTGPGGPLSGITTPASMQRVNMVTYFVTPDGILTRRQYANVPPVVPAVGFVDVPLVYGVEDFQIQYVMDTGALFNDPADPDGVPASGDENTNRLMGVRQIRFTISVRATELNNVGQPNRVSMTSTFSTRNLGYDAS